MLASPAPAGAQQLPGGGRPGRSGEVDVMQAANLVVLKSRVLEMQGSVQRLMAMMHSGHDMQW